MEGSRGDSVSSGIHGREQWSESSERRSTVSSMNVGQEKLTDDVGRMSITRVYGNRACGGAMKECMSETARRSDALGVCASDNDCGEGRQR